MSVRVSTGGRRPRGRRGPQYPSGTSMNGGRSIGSTSISVSFSVEGVHSNTVSLRPSVPRPNP